MTRGRRHDSVAAVAITATAGAGLVLLVAAATGMAAHDVLVLAGLAAVGATAAGAAGALLLWWLRAAPVGRQAVVVALASVAAMAAGVLLAARAMFVSGHDAKVLVVVLAAAGTAGVTAAVTLGSRVGAATRSVEGLARRIGDGDGAGLVRPPATEELARLARQLEATSARLDESMARERALESSRRELMAWVSHDLRTPLAGIKAVVEALEDGIVDDAPTIARYHRTVLIEADRLAGLVDDLFELSRIETANLGLTLERVPLDDVVSDALAGASAVARAKGVHLQGELLEPAPVVHVSTPEMSRVVRNLLDNAIRHTPADGAVTVVAGVDCDRAFVSVLDSCGGIPDDELERVFDLAFRGDPARTPGERGGAGLGLAIARGLVEAHQGDIAVHNEDGGCRFTVRLPLPG